MKHVPGDWKCPDIRLVYAMGDDGREGGEAEANARLIAAAPDLLKGLIRARDAMKKYAPSFFTTDIERAQAVIDRAMRV